jgi:dihydroorotase
LAQPKYDLLVKGGHVIDAKNGISAIDVAIAGGHIAAVTETSLLPTPAKQSMSLLCTLRRGW